MCVGVPAKVIEKDEFSAIVEVDGATMTVGTIFIDDVKPGDYVIVHAGQAMSIIDEQSAKESLATWKALAGQMRV